MNSIIRKLVPIFTILLGVGFSAVQSVPIYGEDSKPVGLSQDAAQSIVGILTLMVFVFLVLEWATPEVLLLSSLIICMLLQILTLPETLSGEVPIVATKHCTHLDPSVIFRSHRFFKRFHDYHWSPLHRCGCCGEITRCRLDGPQDLWNWRISITRADSYASHMLLPLCLF